MVIIPESTLKKYIRTVGECNEVDKIMRLTLVIQRMFGQHILDPDWSWRKYWPYQLFTASLTIYVIFGTFDVLKKTDDVKIVAEASYTLVIATIMPVKYLLFVFKKGVFRKLYVQLKSTLYESIRNESKSKIDMVLNKGSKMVYILFYMIMMPFIAYILRVMWYYVQGERVTISRTSSILMPMRTPYHEIGSVLHSIFMFQASFTIIMIDMWFVLFMYFFCVASDSTVRILDVDKRGRGADELQYAERLNSSLKQFYKVHVEQIEQVHSFCVKALKRTPYLIPLFCICFSYLNAMNEMFKWLALVPLFNVMMSSCIFFLMMSKGIPWSFAPNMIPCFGELFAYNWFGEQIKTKAKELSVALLNFDWVNLSSKNRKSYYIIVSYMQKEFGLKTANGNDLSLITMTAVLKTSYQAYTVLQSLEE